MNRLIVAAAIAACVCAVSAAPMTAEQKKAEAEKKAEAAKRAAKVKELLKEADGDAVHFIKWCAGWQKEHMEGVPHAEIVEMQKRYIAKLEEAAALAPKDLNVLNPLALAYLYKKDYAAARPVFERMRQVVLEGLGEKAASASVTNRVQVRAGAKAAYAWYGLVCCQMADGEGMDAVKKTLDDAARFNFGGTGRGQHDPASMMNTARSVLYNISYDRQKLPWHTGMKAFPEAQQAEYPESFVERGKYELDLDGLEEGSERVKFFTEKFTRLGWEKSEGFWSFLTPAFTVKVAASDPMPECAKLKDFQKREAYSLVVTDDGATIRAATPQGAFWGLVSLIQLADPETGKVRKATILDWPNTERRGFLGSFAGCHQTEMLLMMKANSISIQGAGPTTWNWMTPLEDALIAELGREAQAFGFECYYSITSYTMWDVMPITQPGAYEYLRDIVMHYAAAGLDVYYPYDDGRFDGSGYKKDVAAAGSAAKVDGKFVSKIYREVKAKYPKFRMIFCPPFYWGPDSGHAYPEDREAYLKAMGEDLDPEILMYWTGCMVKGFEKRKYQVDWFTKLTKHKPVIFQNGWSPHNLVSYAVDPLPYDAWDYDGFYTDIDGFHLNSWSPFHGIGHAQLCNILWKREGYDRERSVKLASDLLLGKGVYEVLRPGRDALSYFDKYKYGTLTVDILSEDAGDLERKLTVAKDAWKKACEMNKAQVGLYGAHYSAGLDWAGRVVKGAKNPPDMMKKYEADILATEKYAKEEVGYDKAKGDILVNALHLSESAKIGSYAGNNNTGKAEKRLCRFLRGAQTGQSAVAFSFECDPFPPSGDYELIINGLDDELPNFCTVKIEVNGKTVYEGQKDYSTKQWTRNSYVIPLAAMVRNNRVRISVTTPGTNPNGSPWFIVNYVLLRKK